MKFLKSDNTYFSYISIKKICDKVNIVREFFVRRAMRRFMPHAMPRVIPLMVHTLDFPQA